MADDILLPRILITNDDGIDAPGLALLAEIAAAHAGEVWVVAPESDQSGSSQSLSLCKPLTVTQRGERRFAVSGTPADCVALALDALMSEKERPSLVLSGINPSANIGDAVNLSGTVGAALMALSLGVPAIAISQQSRTRGKPPWETSRAIVPALLRRLLQDGWRKETCLSVNIPDYPPDEITGYAWARQSHKSLGQVHSSRRINPRGQEYYWLSLGFKEPTAHPASEAAILSQGEIAVTALALDRSVEIAKDGPRVRPLPERLEDIAPQDLEERYA